MAKTFLIYLAAGLLAFANGLSGGFMLDDHAFFTPEIKDIRYLPQHFVPKAYKASVAEGVPHGQPNFYYRPFAKILPSAAYAMFGERVFFYHLFNLALLVLAGFLIYLFLMGFGILGQRGAFTAGLMYIVHPINGVVVNYMTASVFALQVIFMVLCLLSLRDLKFNASSIVKEGRVNDPGPTACFNLSFFFVLALMCHETALVLPFYAAILMLCISADGTFRQKVFDAFRLTWILWVTAIGWIIFRFFFASLGDSLFAKFSRFEMGLFEYVASVGKLIFWYSSKLIVPWDIVLIWTTPVVRGIEVWIWGMLMLLMAVFVFYIFKQTQDKVVRLGVLWFVAGFLPLPLMCLFQPTHGPMIEPHWFVFSVIGFFVCAARLLEKCRGVIVKPVFAAVLVVCFISGWRHNHLWADEKRYAYYWSEVSPSIKAVWFHLGEIYFKERRFSQAVGFYERSIRNTYQDYLAYQRMGLAYFEARDFRRAQLNFIVSLHLEPRQQGIRRRLEWIEKVLR